MVRPGLAKCVRQGRLTASIQDNHPVTPPAGQISQSLPAGDLADRAKTERLIWLDAYRGASIRPFLPDVFTTIALESAAVCRSHTGALVSESAIKGSLPSSTVVPSWQSREKVRWGFAPPQVESVGCPHPAEPRSIL
jgi:hypothetical protein